MSIKLIADSTVDLPAHLAPRFTVVPLYVYFGDEEYLDGVTIDHRHFYEKLVESEELPTTSQPTPGIFAQVFAEATADGSEAVVLTISGKLSGTYQSATLAAAEFPGVYVVDSGTATIGAGILAQRAAQLADAGMTAAKIAATLEEERQQVRLVALFDTLEYLKKGGRISKTAAFAGGILSIKPVISIEDGVIRVLGKAKGSKHGNLLMNQEIEKAGGVDFSRPFMLGYTGLEDDRLRRYLADSAALWEEHDPDIAAIGSVIGTHAGPGAFAAAFFSKE